MANTKKNTASATKVEEIDNEKELKVENENLKKDLEQLKEQMANLMTQLAQTTKMEKPSKKSTKLIKFINMSKGVLVLKGSRIIKIAKQFDDVSVTESEASIICSNCPELVRSGAVYVADENFVIEHDLEDSYNCIIDPDTLKSIFTFESQKFIELYRSTTSEQKEILVEMIKDKKRKGEDVDANILFTIGNECGKNLMNIEKED